MTTTTSGSSGADVAWYVRKHRREWEDTLWDERRVREFTPRNSSTTTRVLVKFIALALGLTATVAVIATFTR